MKVHRYGIGQQYSVAWKCHAGHQVAAVVRGEVLLTRYLLAVIINAAVDRPYQSYSIVQWYSSSRDEVMKASSVTNKGHLFIALLIQLSGEVYTSRCCVRAVIGSCGWDPHALTPGPCKC